MLEEFASRHLLLKVLSNFGMTVWCLTFQEFAGHQFQLGTRPWPRWNGYTMLKGNSEQQASVQRDEGASNGRHEARVPFLQFYTTNSVLVFFEKEKHKNPCKGWCHFYMLECPDKARPHPTFNSTDRSLGSFYMVALTKDSTLCFYFYLPRGEECRRCPTAPGPDDGDDAWSVRWPTS